MKSIKSLLLLAAIILLPGCETTERLFNPVEPAPADMGVVNFYRPGETAGGNLNIMLYDNGADISRLQNGQAVKYLATPGEHRFYTDTIEIDRAMVLDVVAGQTYYVKLGLRQGMASGTWALSRVFADEALEEIKSCCMHDFREQGSKIYDETGVIPK